MKIIIHSSYSGQNISTNLGKAEYSYYFVLAGYLPALRQLGDVVTVDQPETDADAIFDRCLDAGEACVFLCFAPPHLVPITLRCPTIPVVAWEFSTIPCEQWGDDPRCDWRVVFKHCGRVIALSNHTAALVRGAMGEDFPVFAIPTASYDGFADIGATYRPSNAVLSDLKGYLFDSAADSRFSRNPPWPPVPAPILAPQEETRLELIPEDITQLEPAAIEPIRPGLRKRISITVYYVRAWYHDALRDLLPSLLTRFASMCGRLTYRTFRARQPPMLPEISAPQQAPASPQPPALPNLALSGVVYSSVFAPQDGRKNWQDLLTGFVRAFRDNSGATLFLKVPVLGGVEAYPVLYSILSQFAPFKCRVILFAGFLDDAQYRKLVQATTFYVNSSHGEGLCLPLMEFLSAGKPAIAPNHTAMADYIDSAIAFVLQANLEHNVWPFDPRDLFTTMRYRLNWESLVFAYEESYSVATVQGARYAEMANAARTAMRAFCSLDIVRPKLAEALGIMGPALISEPHMAEA